MKDDHMLGVVKTWLKIDFKNYWQNFLNSMALVMISFIRSVYSCDSAQLKSQTIDQMCIQWCMVRGKQLHIIICYLVFMVHNDIASSKRMPPWQFSATIGTSIKRKLGSRFDYQTRMRFCGIFWKLFVLEQVLKLQNICRQIKNLTIWTLKIFAMCINTTHGLYHQNRCWFIAFSCMNINYQTLCKINLRCMARLTFKKCDQLEILQLILNHANTTKLTDAKHWQCSYDSNYS